MTVTAFTPEVVAAIVACATYSTGASHSTTTLPLSPTGLVAMFVVIALSATALRLFAPLFAERLAPDDALDDAGDDDREGRR